MAPHEESAIRQLAGDVRELSEKFNELCLDVRTQLTNEKNCRSIVQGIHVTLFGIDGDFLVMKCARKQGLKGVITYDVSIKPTYVTRYPVHCG